MFNCIIFQGTVLPGINGQILIQMAGKVHGMVNRGCYEWGRIAQVDGCNLKDD
jgi:hypothetical protein